MATIKDVARHVGLSVTTVSRALNNYDDVAETTRERVRAVARTLDYHPNAVARSLQGSQTDTVGLVIPLALHRSYDAFWLEFIGGMVGACAPRGVDVLVSAANPHGDLGDGFERLVRGGRVDGLLVCDIRRADPRIAYLRGQNIPFVAFGRTLEEQDYPFIDVDGTAGVAAAVEHLIALGHRRIAYLGLDADFGFSPARFAGYRAALTRAGMDDDETLVCHGLTEETAARALVPLLARPDRPSAIFAGADFLALATLRAARAAGLDVPGDLSVAVFDDNPLVRHAEPSLTAVSQPNHHLGEEAAVLLLDRVADPARPPAQRLITPTLIVRRSTAFPERLPKP